MSAGTPTLMGPPAPSLRRRLLTLACLLTLLTLFYAAPALADTNTGISGTVTDGSGNPVVNIQVTVYDATTSAVVNTTCVRSADGSYSFTLAPGSYYVQFQTLESGFNLCGGHVNYLPQYYGPSSTQAGATQVSVVGGAVTPNINATLLPGGAIAGTVTDATTGSPVGGVEVDALDSSGSVMSAACTAPDGTYSLYSLATGSYSVEFRNSTFCGNPTSYVTLYYQQGAPPATPVAVNVTQVTSPIDASLTPGSPAVLTTQITGSGVVTVTPSGARCTNRCAYDYTPGATVTLAATPAGGSAFTGWSGGGCSGTGTCTVTMNASQTVTAQFAAPGTGTGATPPGSIPTGQPPISSPPVIGHESPRCGVLVASTLLVYRPARRHARARLGHLLVGYNCAQGAVIDLRASLQLTWPLPKHHAKHARARTQRVSLRPVILSARPGWGTVSMPLPSSVARALAHRARIVASVAMSFTYSGGTGLSSSRASLRIIP